jgi:hypothetical protein
MTYGLRRPAIAPIASMVAFTTETKTTNAIVARHERSPCGCAPSSACKSSSSRRPTPASTTHTTTLAVTRNCHRPSSVAPPRASRCGLAPQSTHRSTANAPNPTSGAQAITTRGASKLRLARSLESRTASSSRVAREGMRDRTRSRNSAASHTSGASSWRPRRRCSPFVGELALEPGQPGAGPGRNVATLSLRGPERERRSGPAPVGTTRVV